MIVDDMECNRLILKTILKDKFTIVECDSGPKCIEMVENDAPDMILLDVNMPELTGYEVCTELRKHSKTATLPIIFVSGMDNVEERLAGFEAGGDAYITKPIDPDLLLKQINSNFAHLGEVKAAKDSADYAMKVAMEAMTSSSELGQIIEFVKSSQDVATLEGIGEKFCEVAQVFGLTASALVYGPPQHYINCIADSMEAKVLRKFQNSKDSILSIGVRTMVRSNSMALLINDMPVDDDTRYGRLKDHLMVLSSICDGRLLTIKASLSITGERMGVLSRIIKMTEEQVMNLTHKIAEHDTSTRAVMLDMVTELEAKLFTLGLDEDQEEQLMSLAYNASETLDKLKGGVEKLEDELGVVLEGLYQVLNSIK